jgi:hypothetical protein
VLLPHASLQYLLSRGEIRPFSAFAFLALAVWACPPFCFPLAFTFPGLTDVDVHEPPWSGTYAYDTLTPTNPLFPDIGVSYVDPVFSTEITRLSDIYPQTGSGIIYGVNGLRNADGTAYLTDTVGGAWP